jgi:hypothetical protein
MFLYYGFELYEQLKKVDSDIKICFLTASEMYYERNRGIEHCALLYFWCLMQNESRY